MQQRLVQRAAVRRRLGGRHPAVGVSTPIQQDERVGSAAKHWALRFVSNGVELGAFQSTLQRITRWEEWCAEWGVTAEHYEALAEVAESRGDVLTAGEAWVRAATCWHFGKFVFTQD